MIWVLACPIGSCPLDESLVNNSSLGTQIGGLVFSKVLRKFGKLLLVWLIYQYDDNSSYFQ